MKTSSPLASELQGVLADGFADRLVGRDGGEPGGLGFAPLTREVNQTQCLTLRPQLRRPRPCVELLLVEVVGFDVRNFGQRGEVLFAIGFGCSLGQVVLRHQG